MARPTGSCPPRRKPLLSDRETALGRRSFRPSPCRGRHPSSPRRRGGSNIHSYFWPMWLKYSFPLVAQILVPTWLKYSLTFTLYLIDVDFLMFWWLRSKLYLCLVHCQRYCNNHQQNPPLLRSEGPVSHIHLSGFFSYVKNHSFESI